MAPSPTAGGPLSPHAPAAAPPPDFCPADWLRALTRWLVEERGSEVAEQLSDAPNLASLGSLTALHLRRHARDRGLSGFWARQDGEGGVVFGRAETPFDAWHRSWWETSPSVLGRVETAVLCWHYAASKNADIMRAVTSRLTRPLGATSTSDAPGQRPPTEIHRLTLVWLFDYLDPSTGLDEEMLRWTERSLDSSWSLIFGPELTPLEHDEPGATTRATAPGTFRHISRLPLANLWPVQHAPALHVGVALCRFEPSTAGPRSPGSGEISGEVHLDPSP